MSVIKFSVEEWRVYKGMYRYWANGPDRLSRCFSYTRKFLTSKPFATEDELEARLPDWLFLQLERCNRFAWAAQYSEEISAEEMSQYEKISACTPIKCSRYELLTALKHIAYNLDDNCGNSYLPAGYQELFDALMHSVLDMCAEAYKVHLAAHELRAPYELQRTGDL